MDILTFALICGCALAGFLAGASYIARFKPRDPRVVKVGKALSEVQIELSDLRDLYERLLASHKRLRSSAGMAKLRATQSDDLSKEPEAVVLSRLGITGRRK